VTLPPVKQFGQISQQWFDRCFRIAHISVYSYRNASANKSVFSCLRTLTTWHCPHLQAARRCCSCRSISPIRRARSSKRAAAGLLLRARAGRDGRTDGQTDTAPFHRHCSANYAASANKQHICFPFKNVQVADQSVSMEAMFIQR